MKHIVPIFSIILVLTSFSCNRKDSIKQYIEKGFSKPQIDGDARFTVQNMGDEGKLYVPSEQEVEVEFSINNKYEQEIKPEVYIPNGKKILFNQEPK